MVENVIGGEREYSEDRLIALPASELLQDPSEIIRVWPDEVSKNPSFLKQVEAHRAQIAAVQDVIATVTDPTLLLESALTYELVKPEQLTILYEQLAELLLSEDTARLVLYLPFEFLPTSSWQPDDALLTSSLDTFKTAYLYAWNKQLSVHDVRANFADGNVLEESQRISDLPRIVKAAHLIPELLKRGLLDDETVQHLLNTTADDVLKNSIFDAIGPTQTNTVTINPINPNILTASVAPTKRRQEWLEQKDTNNHISTLADQLSHYIIDSIHISSEVPNVSFQDTSEVGRLILIQALQTAIEQAERDGSMEGKKIFDFFRTDLIHQLQTTKIITVKEGVSQLLRRVQKLGFVSEPELTNLAISIPHFTGNLTKNLENMTESVQHIEELVYLIQNDPMLDTMLFPVISIGGSRLKGYGTEKSDLDMSIYIRPGTPEDRQQELHNILQTYLHSIGIDDEPTEFWLEKDRDNLIIKSPQDPQAVTANTYWTHTLFTAPMIGDREAIDSLRKQLLTPYFTAHSSKAFGRTDRALYLERIEQDLLQYRLLHKGYARHYPRVTDPREKAVDGDSMFWDSGYRRLATQLFVEKVFLPKIIL